MTHAEKVMQAARLAWFNRPIGMGTCPLCFAKWSPDAGYDVSGHEFYCGYRILREALGDEAYMRQDKNTGLDAPVVRSDHDGPETKA